MAREGRKERMVSEEEGWKNGRERLNGEPDGIYSGEFAGSWVSLCFAGISIDQLSG